MVAGPAVVEKARIWRTRSTSLLQTLSSVCNSAQAQSYRISFSFLLSSQYNIGGRGLRMSGATANSNLPRRIIKVRALSRDFDCVLFLDTLKFTTSEFLLSVFLFLIFFFRFKVLIAESRVVSPVVSCLRFVRGRICVLFFLQISARNCISWSCF